MANVVLHQPYTVGIVFTDDTKPETDQQEEMGVKEETTDE